MTLCNLMGGLCSHSVGCMSWGDPVLEPAGYCVGLVSKWQPPGALMPMFILRVSATSSCPHSHSQCLPSQQTLQDPQVGLVLLWSHWSALSPSTCEHLICRVEFLLPSMLWGFCTQALLTFKAKCFGGPPSNATLPGWGVWHGAQSSHYCGKSYVI